MTNHIYCKMWSWVRKSSLWLQSRSNLTGLREMESMTWYLEGGWLLTPDLNYFLGSVSFVLKCDMCLLQWEGQRDIRLKVAQKSGGFHCQTKEWMEFPKCEWACTVVPSDGGRNRTEHKTYWTSFLGIFTWGLGALTHGGGRPPQACVS